MRTNTSVVSHADSTHTSGSNYVVALKKEIQALAFGREDRRLKVDLEVKDLKELIRVNGVANELRGMIEHCVENGADFYNTVPVPEDDNTVSVSEDKEKDLLDKDFSEYDDEDILGNILFFRGKKKDNLSAYACEFFNRILHKLRVSHGGYRANVSLTRYRMYLLLEVRNQSRTIFILGSISRPRSQINRISWFRLGKLCLLARKIGLGIRQVVLVKRRWGPHRMSNLRLNGK